MITEKDWSKLESLPDADWPCPVVRPRLRIEVFENGPALTDAVLDAVRAHARAPGPDPLTPDR